MGNAAGLNGRVSNADFRFLTAVCRLRNICRKCPPRVVSRGHDQQPRIATFPTESKYQLCLCDRSNRFFIVDNTWNDFDRILGNEFINEQSSRLFNKKEIATMFFAPAAMNTVIRENDSRSRAVMEKSSGLNDTFFVVCGTGQNNNRVWRVDRA